MSLEAAAALMCKLGCLMELLQSSALAKVPTELDRQRQRKGYPEFNQITVKYLIPLKNVLETPRTVPPPRTDLSVCLSGGCLDPRLLFQVLIGLFHHLHLLNKLDFNLCCPLLQFRHSSSSRCQWLQSVLINSI